MSGSALYVTFKPLPRKKQSSLDELVARFAEAIHQGVREGLRRKRDLVLAGLREESDHWSVLGDKLFLGFSDDSAPIVRHAAAMALIRERARLGEFWLPPLGYQLAPSDPINSVAPLRAAVWGTAGEPGSRSLGGPFVASDGDDLGWSEAEPSTPTWRSGLCACELCARIWTGSVLSRSSYKRSGRGAAIDHAWNRLDEFGPARSREVLDELKAWSWSGTKLPASFSNLLAEIGRPAPTPLELAGILGVRGATPP